MKELKHLVDYLNIVINVYVIDDGLYLPTKFQGLTLMGSMLSKNFQKLFYDRRQQRLF